MLRYGNITTSIDLDGSGKRNGFLDLNHSDNQHAFSSIRLPIGIISGKPGPTLLITAGSHGDEYEGQVISHQLMQHLSPDDLTGRIILLPALNLPAVRERTRVSPLDKGNMNLSFSSQNHGPTANIAGFVNQHLIPMSDIIIDIHSGGTATQYVDCTYLCRGSNHVLNKSNLELADVFGANFIMVHNIDGTSGDFDTAAYRQGKRFLSCELGGMGSLNPSSKAVGWNGIMRILHHLKMITSSEIPLTKETPRLIDVTEDMFHITSLHHGLASWEIELGQYVQAGDHLATIYDSHNFGTILAKMSANREGIVAVCRRNPLIEPGDHLFMICPEIKRNNYLW